MAIGTEHKLARFLWGDTGPAGHACQIYGSDAELVDTLTGFAGGALWNGDGVIVVATNAHIDALELRLRESGLDLGFLRGSDRFVPASAEMILGCICGDGEPDEARFGEVIGELVARASHGGRRVRVFGEMVALLFGQGKYIAALELEEIWNRYLHGRGVPLLCAYPRVPFAAAGAEHTAAVQRAHTVFVS
jgi:hypothetical protein